MADQAHQLFSRRVGDLHVRVTHLPLLGRLAFLRQGLVNLPQDLVEQGAVLMLRHPDFETFQRAVIRPIRVHRVAHEPLHDQVKANLPLQLTQ